jgi:hypothetical protein
MKIKKIKDIVFNKEDRHQILWEIENAQKFESFEETFETKFIVSSAVFVENFFTGERVPETFLFPANENGQITSFLELRGSLNRVFDHEKAIENAGFTIVESF